MMATRSWCVSALAFALAVSWGAFARAAEVTVSGGTWSGAGVQAGDDVTITGSCENDIADVVLGSLKVEAPEGTTIEISGKAFSFGSSEFKRTDAGTVKFLTDVHGTGTVTLSNGKTYLYGPTCGLGDADSTLILTSLNAYLYLGGTTLKNGIVRTTYRCNFSRVTSGNQAYSFPFDALGNTANVVEGRVESTCSSTQKNLMLPMYPRDGGTLELKGGIGGTSVAGWYSCPEGGSYNYYGTGKVTISTTPWECVTFGGVDYTFGCGLTTVAVAGMKVSGYVHLGAANASKAPKLETTVDWAFNSLDAATKATLTGRIGSNNYAPMGYIDLHATRQRFGGFYSPAGSLTTGSITGASDGDAKPVFYCRQCVAGANNGVELVNTMNILGDVTFVKEGPYPLTLGGTASTTAGDLKVTEGTLTLTSGAKFSKLGAVVVGKAADDEETVVSEEAVAPKLVLKAATNIGADAALRLNGNGVIEIPDGAAPAFDRIYIDGVEMPVGEYSATACPWMVPADKREAVMAHFTGGGKIRATNGQTVEIVATSWTGLGDGSTWNDADNWSNGKPGMNGAVTIELAANDEVKEIVNDIDGLILNSLTLTGAGSLSLSGQPISLLEGGLVAGSDDADTTAVTNAVGFDITLAASQTWSIRGTKRELRLAGSFDTTASAYSLTRNGKGVWRLYADNSGDGDITLDKDNGATYAYSPNCAFGSASSTLTVKGQSIYEPKNTQGGAKLHLCGTVVSNGVIRFDGYYVRLGSGNCEYWLISDAADRENVVLSEIQFASPPTNHSLCLANPKGQRLVLAGGCAGVLHILQLTALSPTEYKNDNVGTLVLTNSPWHVTGDLGTESMTAGIGNLVWAAPGSTLGGRIYWQGQSKITSIAFAEDWSLGANEATTDIGIFRTRFSSSTQYYTGCPVHFGATKQRIGGFALNVTGDAEFDGDAGSVFYCRQTAANVTIAAPVKNALSFVKEGDKRITFTKASDTTGTLGVAEGSLFLAEEATWANSTNVFVSADALLSVSNQAVFAAKPTVAIAEGGTLDLAFSGRLKVETLTLGDTIVRGGEWGGPQSDAANKSPLLSGTGILRVGTPGLMLLLR